jgi:hypothetical protein
VSKLVKSNLHAGIAVEEVGAGEDGVGEVGEAVVKSAILAGWRR